MHEAIDWEPIKDNYERIKKKIRNFHDSKKSEGYPHNVTVLKQERIVSKVK